MTTAEQTHTTRETQTSAEKCLEIWLANLALGAAERTAGVEDTETNVRWEALAIPNVREVILHHVVGVFADLMLQDHHRDAFLECLVRDALDADQLRELRALVS